jgi:hypothetical protein
MAVCIIFAIAVAAFIAIPCTSVFSSEQHHSNKSEEVKTSHIHESEAEAEGMVPLSSENQNPESYKKKSSLNANHGKVLNEYDNTEEQSVKKSEKPEEPEVTGVRFAEASVEVLKKELNSFWGWRPNDYITFFTDNRKNFQLGVLEVTRRAAVELSERISRTGSTASLNRNLEDARNLLMVKADAYMFPSAGFSYEDAVKDIEKYREQLTKGHASFFNRTDNLIPLLQRFEDILGSCDENLVKQTEDDGTTVSTFAADDYFYYAQGVAYAMLPILEAIGVDFHETIVSRLSGSTLHHIIHSCEEAANLHPWIVFNGDLDGFIANHRANMATFISHARFYVGVLIKTLST